MAERWLITGGCGFLGSNLAASLLERGVDVVVVDNLSRLGSMSNLEWLREKAQADGAGELLFSPADTRRHAHASAIEHDLFECRYPLREWKWDRAACIARIEAAGLPVPPKSSCFMLCLQMVSRLTTTLYLWATKLSAV